MLIQFETVEQQLQWDAASVQQPRKHSLAAPDWAALSDVDNEREAWGQRIPWTRTLSVHLVAEGFELFRSGAIFVNLVVKTSCFHIVHCTVFEENTSVSIHGRNDESQQTF